MPSLGTTLQIVGEKLCEALDLRAGQKVLDVAAGNGNVTLAAARRWCDVVSTDYVPSLLERGRARASAEGLAIEFKEADAEALPFADASFDAVVSTFGVMFTPNQDKAAAELLRVCKPGGQIGLANWTPDGFIGQLFKTLGKYLPPPAGAKSPALWGTRARLTELFGPAAPRSRPSRATSTSATARRSTFSTCSRPTTARCSRRLPRSTGQAERPDERPARPHRAHEQSQRRHHGRAERVSGSRHSETMTFLAAGQKLALPDRIPNHPHASPACLQTPSEIRISRNDRGNAWTHRLR